MITQIDAYKQKSSKGNVKNYGITETKKAELDRLTDEVIDAQGIVDQNQAIVNSLNQKLSTLNGYLAAADATRTVAKNNWNTILEVISNARDLKSNSEVATEEMIITDKSMKDLALKVKEVMNELIYSVEVANRLSNLVLRKKAQNPLIPDELISLLTTTGKDANNAIALTLTALKSVFAAQASSMEAEAAAGLEYMQSLTLFEVLTGTNYKGKRIKEEPCIKDQLNDAYTRSEKMYIKWSKAVKMTTSQLNVAQANLETAEVKLTSLQSGLAAANAAALAS